MLYQKDASMARSKELRAEREAKDPGSGIEERGKKRKSKIKRQRAKGKKGRFQRAPVP
jgi:hypothetical protein